MINAIAIKLKPSAAMRQCLLRALIATENVARLRAYVRDAATQPTQHIEDLLLATAFTLKRDDIVDRDSIVDVALTALENVFVDPETKAFAVNALRSKVELMNHLAELFAVSRPKSLHLRWNRFIRFLLLAMQIAAEQSGGAFRVERVEQLCRQRAIDSFAYRRRVNQILTQFDDKFREGPNDNNVSARTIASVGQHCAIRYDRPETRRRDRIEERHTLVKQTLSIKAASETHVNVGERSVAGESLCIIRLTLS